jgi:hypothetical protein
MNVLNLRFEESLNKAQIIVYKLSLIRLKPLVIEIKVVLEGCVSWPMGCYNLYVLIMGPAWVRSRNLLVQL